MNKKLKKSLIEFAVFGGVLLTLYLTGLHTEVLGFFQRGLLKTGIFNPELAVNHDADEVPKPLADYRLRLINAEGENVSMEEFRGKVIFLNLWATWCPPCIAEMPGINQLFNAVQGEDVVFLMLSVDDDFEKAKNFVEKKGYDFEIYTLAGAIPSMYNSQSIPATFVIDAKGELALVHKGMADYSDNTFKDFLLALKPSKH